MSKRSGMRKCEECGAWHPVELLEPIFRWPDDIAAVPRAQWELRVRGNEDLCLLDRQRYFVRCILPFRVHDRDQDFSIGCWAEVNRADFDAIVALWRDPNQEEAAPFAATVANALPNFPDMRGLPVSLQLRSLQLRPALTVTDETHPFFADQRDGIRGHRVFELQGRPS